jgi:hypothetical protein
MKRNLNYYQVQTKLVHLRTEHSNDIVDWTSIFYFEWFSSRITQIHSYWQTEPFEFENFLPQFSFSLRIFRLKNIVTKH